MSETTSETTSEATSEPTPTNPPTAPWLRPIYELELVISGAVIVGLFQIPGVLDDKVLSLLGHVSDDAVLLPLFAYVLGQFAMIALIAVFMIHFIARCLWVGAEGLRRAFPEGIDWSKIDFGPVTKQFYQNRHVDLATFSTRVDRFASSLFAALFMIIVGLVQACVYVLLIAGLAYGVQRALPHLPLIDVFFWIYLAVFGPLLVMALWVATTDKAMRKDPSRLESRPRTSAFVQTALKTMYYLNLAFIHQPVMLVFRSRVTGVRFQIITLSIVLIMMGVTFASIVWRMAGVRMDSYVYFPPLRGNELAIDPGSYESMRGPDASHLLPTIESDVISSPALRVFLPFDADDGNKVVANSCPEVEPYRAEGLHRARRSSYEPDPTRDAAVLECLSNMATVQLDGVAVQPDWRFSARSSDGKAGLMGYIDLSTHEPGMHSLHIIVVDEVVDTPETADAEHDDGLRDYHIPFWYAPS